MAADFDHRNYLNNYDYMQRLLLLSGSHGDIKNMTIATIKINMVVNTFPKFYAS
jgi:hypothetical protein